MKQLRTLLINPPARDTKDEPMIIPPLGIAYLAAEATKAGFNVDLLDAFGERLNWEQFEKRVKLRTYDVIGFSGMTPVFDTVKRAIKICRSLAPTLILGGPHATAFKENVFADIPELDFIFIGEGERSFVEFLSRKQRNLPLLKIPGVIQSQRESNPAPAKGLDETLKEARIADGLIPAILIEDLDSIAFPLREKLPWQKYRYPLDEGQRVTTIISSRGCPYPCIFCDKGVFGSHWRGRSAQNVLQEIDEVVTIFQVDSIIFYDDLFTLDKNRLKSICDGLIERQYKLSWKAEGRVNLVETETLQLMKKAGCDTIAYGVESANQQGLDFLRKKTTPTKALKAFYKTRKAGIKTMGYFILGIPVETYEDAQKTIQFAIDLRADYAQFSILSPLPGTVLYQQAKENKWYAEVNAQNFFDKDQQRPVILSENWSEEKLARIIKEAHRKFYFRPRYILKNLKSRLKSGNFSKLGNLGLGLLKYILK